MSNDAKPSANPATATRNTTTTFSAGRDNKGAFAVGKGATATNISTEAPPANPGIDLAAVLDAIRVQLAQIPEVDPKALTRLDEAKTEAAKPAPEPEEVTSLVEQATRYATKAASFAAAAEKLGPLVKQVWEWAGAALPDWASAVGLQ
ncbi:MAG TPA: hypothetical protein VMB73_17900 [Acetobacteraceae bacterium]|nr:hypothetical protein [Acetobacteraceae bacterium]